MVDDIQIRMAAFKWLDEQVIIHGDVLTRSLIEAGFTFKGKIIKLISPQGIFKPQGMKLPLTITTTPISPYYDKEQDDGLIHYYYRGTNQNHRDNVGLRECMKRKLPLIYFWGISPGKYEPIYPVLIVGDDPASLVFTVAADISESFVSKDQFQYPNIADEDIRRRYITTAVRQRLHQHKFRELVLTAYRDQCALCRLKHRELLDAAHIVGDKEPEGEPKINNGISMCKIHHAAFERYFIGISPDYIIETREDIRKEENGPMLRHGLQELHGSRLVLPPLKKHWPDRELLNWKYKKYRKVM